MLTAAKRLDRKLKVFAVQIGFYDTIVAAASQATALRIWETRQNLFASGQARVIDDPKAVQAALAQPGIPLRRVIGTNNPFELNPVGLPDIPDAPNKRANGIAANRSFAKPGKAAKRPADRLKLDKAEASLRQIDDSRKVEEADLRKRQGALDDERSAKQSSYIEHRKAATAAVVAARQLYRKAGGTD